MSENRLIEAEDNFNRLLSQTRALLLVLTANDNFRSVDKSVIANTLWLALDRLKDLEIAYLATVRGMSLCHESQLEKKLVCMVQNRGGLVHEFVIPDRQEVAGRIVIWPGGSVHFVELKSSKGEAGKLHISEHKKLVECGCKVFTLYGLPDVQQYIAYMESTLSEKAVA